MQMIKQKKQIPVVTTLGNNVKKDYNSRVRNYSIIMFLRMLCIVLIFVIPYPWNIVPIVFAVASPWFAVLIANNSKPTSTNSIESPIKELL